MEPKSMGALIRALRQEKHMTQRQLADALCVTDRAVSKWECGNGCPDISVVPALAKLLEVAPEELLAGKLTANRKVPGNMKRVRFSVCPSCGMVTMASGEAAVFCCGRRLEALEARKPDETNDINAEASDGEWYITTGHPMEREHYISFLALLNGDTAVMRRCYPEWELQAHLPYMKHGRLVWYCTRDGLFYRDL